MTVQRESAPEKYHLVPDFNTFYHCVTKKLSGSCRTVGGIFVFHAPRLNKKLIWKAKQLPIKKRETPNYPIFISVPSSSTSSSSTWWMSLRETLWRKPLCGSHYERENITLWKMTNQWSVKARIAKQQLPFSPSAPAEKKKLLSVRIYHTSASCSDQQLCRPQLSSKIQRTAQSSLRPLQCVAVWRTLRRTLLFWIKYLNLNAIVVTWIQTVSHASQTNSR